MKMTRCITRNPKDERVERWREEMGDKTTWIMQTEKLAPRYNNSWMIWRSLYRLRTKVGRCKANLKKWGYLEDPLSAARNKQWITYCYAVSAQLPAVKRTLWWQTRRQ